MTTSTSMVKSRLLNPNIPFFQTSSRSPKSSHSSTMTPTNENNAQQQQTPMARYTEVNQNGDVIYQSDSVPVEVAATYLQPRDTIAQRNAAMTGEKTSDQYRTFDIPAKFDNPGEEEKKLSSSLKMTIVIRFRFVDRL